MKKVIILLMLPVYYYSQKDSTEIKQTVFFSEVLGKYSLVTNNGEVFDSVVHGTLEFMESQKIVEFNKALARRMHVAIIKVRCN